MAQNVIATTVNSSQRATVSAAANSGGELLIVSRPTTQISIVNISTSAGIEYKVGNDAWKYLAKGIGAVLDIDVSKTRLLFRLVNDGSSSAQIEASLVSASSIDPMVLQSRLSQSNRCVLVGDSNTHQNFALSYISSLSRANGIATVTFTAQPFYMYPGCPIQVVGAPEDLRGNQVVSEVVSTTTYRYLSPGPDIASATLSGTPSAANMSNQMDNGWFNWANILSGQRFDLAAISAAVGRTTDEMLLRIHEAASVDAPYAFVMGGTNDVNGSRSVDSITANLQGIYECLLASGKRVYALTVMPMNTGSLGWTAAKAALILQVNAWIRNYCRTTSGMHCIDAFSVLVDPLAANKGQAASGMINTVDGLHLTQRGAYTLGKLVRDETTGTPRNDFRTTSNADNYATNTSNRNVVAEAPWTASGGTPTTLGTGFIGSNIGGGTAVTSTTARSDGFGFNNKADITAAAINDGYRVRTADIAMARTPAGSRVRGDVTVSVTNNAGKFRGVTALISMVIGGQTATVTGLNTSNPAAADAIQEDWSGVIRTPEIQMTAGSTGNSNMRVDCQLVAAGTLSIEIGRCQVTSIPAGAVS